MKVLATSAWQSFNTTAAEYIMVKSGAVVFSMSAAADHDDGLVLDRNDAIAGSTIRVETGRTIYYRAIRDGSWFVREGFA